MSRLPPSLALLAALTLAACTTVGPDYHVPAAAAVQRPATQAAFAERTGPGTSAAPLPDNWWHLYRSTELDALVEQALAANTSVRAAAAHLRRAAAQVAVVDAERLPHGGLTAGAKRARESGEAFLMEEQLPVMNEGEVVASVSYQLDLWGQLKRGEEAAGADHEAVAAALDLARITVVAQVVQSYLQVCHAQAQQAVAQQALQLREQSQALARRLTDAGRGNSAELLRAEALVESQRATLPRLAAERDGGVYRLAYLLGRAPQELPADTVSCAAPPRLAQAIPVGDGAALLRRRPDIRRAERELAAATARIGVATAALYPSISLGASLGAIGLVRNLGAPATQTYGIGPLLSWHFPDDGARARVHMAEADEQAALARFDGEVLRALADTETALSRYRHDLQRQDALRQARDKAAAVAGEQQRFVAAGRRPLAAALDARQTLSAADAALAAGDADVAQDQVRLFLALGGGWETPPTTVSKAATAPR